MAWKRKENQPNRRGAAEGTAVREGAYLPDLHARPLVGLQLIQDPLSVLQHHVDLLPHLPLCVCGLGICRTTTRALLMAPDP